MNINMKIKPIIKLLPLILLLCIMAVANVSVSAAQSGTCGTNLTWTLDDEGTLTISGTGDMTNWGRASSVPWYNNSTDIKSVVIGDGVTSIGDYAFYGCSNLTSIAIPDSVTSIGDYAFYGCSSLTSIAIPDSVTSIGDWAFSDCRSLTSIAIPDSVTSIGNYAFRYCSSLTSIAIPDSVTSIGNDAFSSCRSLTSIYVSDKNLYYTSVDGVLFNKNKTTLIQYPEGNTQAEYKIPEGVTNIGDYAFYGCSKLVSIAIPDSVTSIGNYAFDGCSSLTSITIPDSVTSIGNDTFSSCRSLTSIEIPDNVMIIGYRAFMYCSSLTDVYYGGDRSKWSSISIGSYNTHLTDAKIHYNSSMPEEGNIANGTCGEILTWALADDGTLTISRTGDMTNWSHFSDVPWYSYRESIKAVVIGDGVTSIGKYSFYNCSSLTSINVDSNNANYSSLNGVLFNKNKTILIQYPAGNTQAEYKIPEGVTSIDNDAFRGCSSLTSIAIPEGVTSIGNDAFDGCSSLMSIDVGDKNLNYTSVDGVLFNKNKTILIKYPAGNTLAEYKIPDSVTSIGGRAFYSCGNLNDINVHYSLKSEESTLKEGNSAKVNYYSIVTYMLDGALLEKLIVFEGEAAMLPNPPEGYAYKFTANGSAWNGENITSDVTVSVTKKLKVYTVNFVGDYTGSVKAEHGSNADLPQPPTGYNYIFTANGTTWNGENITSDVTVTVTKKLKVYTVNFVGDYTGSVKVEHGSNVPLPEPPTGYNYTFTANSSAWNGKNITSDLTVTVTKKLKIYTITFVGDYTGSVKAEHGSNADLPQPPTGYSYTFTVNGSAWNGKNITSDVTVTVKALRDLCEIIDINDCYDFHTAGNSITASTYFGYLISEDISVSDGASFQMYADLKCTNELKHISVLRNSDSSPRVSTFYVKVTAESGRSVVYTVNVTRTPVVSLGNIEFKYAIGGHIVLQLANAVPGNAKVWIEYSRNGSSWAIAETEYDAETLLVQATGLSEQTKYFVKVAASYLDEPYPESGTIEITTTTTVSSECDIIDIISPANAEYDAKNGIISAKVANIFSTYTVNVEVSPHATWALYRTSTATTPIADNTLTLREGKNTTAYIKVVAEDGYTTKTYAITIYRQRKSATPNITAVNGKVTITAVEGSKILYTTDNIDPVPGIVGTEYIAPFDAENGTVIKAIALNPGIEEYSDVVIYHVVSIPETVVECLYCENTENGVEYEFYLSTKNTSGLHGTFYIAAYNSSGQLVGIDSTKLDTEEIEQDLYGTLSVSEPPKYCKVFFWGGSDGVTPLCGTDKYIPQ